MLISAEFFLHVVGWMPVRLNFFNWLFIVALTARSYRNCHRFSVCEWYCIDTLNLNRHIWYFFLIHGRHLPDHGYQVSTDHVHPPWTTMTSGNPSMSHHIWDFPTHGQTSIGSWTWSSLQATSDVNNHQATASMSYYMSSDYTVICWGT